MLTVLFVMAILFAFYMLLSLVDGQRVASREVGSYLHYEYNMMTNSRPTMAQLRNM